MPITFGEYVNIVADDIAACAGFPPSVQEVIAETGDFLDDIEMSADHTNWFWQMVAGELMRRRPAEPCELADDLTRAAEDVLIQVSSYGAIL
jgi:hypothetical protein